METAHRFVDLARGPREHIGLLAHLVKRLLDSMQDHEIGYRLDEIEDVVEARGQAVDVLPVEGRDERGVQGAHDLVGDLVALVLPRLDLRVRGLRVPIVGQELEEELGGVREIRRRLLEEVEEALLPRDDLETHPTSTFPPSDYGSSGAQSTRSSPWVNNR